MFFFENSDSGTHDCHAGYQFCCCLVTRLIVSVHWSVTLLCVCERERMCFTSIYQGWTDFCLFCLFLSYK